MNSVKLYSNGTAVIIRDYPLGEKETKVSIPVRKSDLDDVVASISVFGNVTMPEPPSYSPVNANATKLTINPSSALKDTATKLAGSNVEVEQIGSTKVTGKLVGVHTYEETNANGMTTERLKIVVLTGLGIVTIDESNLLSLKFTDEPVQSEYAKALQRSYESIKPDSSFINLTIVPQEGEKRAVISYATPVAAWKIRYQLRFLKGVCELEGQAVVDNDTDDDWKDSIISVITGEPITFDTDLAEIRRPARCRVNVVSDQAQGAVAVEDTFRRATPLRGFAAEKSVNPSVGCHTTGFVDDPNSLQQLASGDGSLDMFYSEQFGAPAKQQQAEVRESGDFSVFTSPNSVSVGSKKSAIIPMFRTTLGESKIVLVYKGESDVVRPFRAIKLKNETTHSLGKGVCEVFSDGDFQGKCILEATKPGQESFLVHAKETGVKVHREASPLESKRVGIRITDGVAYCEQSSRSEITYVITNSKPEIFDLEIEHVRSLTHSTAQAKVSDGEIKLAETPSGWRASVKLPANGEITVVVAESSLQQAGYSIGHERGALWLQQNVIAVKNPLARNKGILKVIELQSKVDEIQHQFEAANIQVDFIKVEQARLLTLIPNAHADQSNKWKSELGDNETSLRQLQRETLPDLTKKMRVARQEVLDALSDLSANWTDKKEEAANGK